MEKTASILIPVHNGLSFTRQCIHELLTALVSAGISSNTFSLVVIDDGSTDGTPEWITSNYPNIHLLRGDGNLWWSGAINLGINYALTTLQSEWVLLWNNDITPGEEFFSAVNRLMQSSETSPITCSMVFFKNRPDILISTGGYFNARTGKIGLFNYNKNIAEAKLNGLEIQWSGGMGTLIKKDVFITIGNFNQLEFPQYYGDSDFGIRARQAGFDFQLVKEMKIWNDASHSGIHRSMRTKDFIRSFYSLQSAYNIGKDLLFYRKYAVSIFAYRTLIRKYFLYMASFVKWKLLTVFGIKKN
jgi:GT2 family glycosyltransferase